MKFLLRARNSAILTICLLITMKLQASARPVHEWSADELSRKADVIVIATIVSTKDAYSVDDKSSKDDTWVPVNSVFDIQSVLKGNLDAKTVTIQHYRFPNWRAAMQMDGPDFIEFKPGDKTRYLIYLQKYTDTVYVPLSGQMDPADSFSTVQSYYYSRINEQFAKIQSDDPIVRRTTSDQILADRVQLIYDLLVAAQYQVTTADKLRKELRAGANANGQVPVSVESEALIRKINDAAAAAGTIIGSLGALHAVEVAPYLVDHIAFTSGDSVLVSNTTLWPCMSALVEIGIPALNALVLKVSETNDTNDPNTSFSYRLAANTAISIIGRPAAIAFAQSKASQETNPSKQQRINDWIKVITSISDGPRTN